MARLKLFSKRDKAAMKKLRDETTPSIIPPKLPPLPTAYKTGVVNGVAVIKILLHPSVKSIIDLMAEYKNSYIGIVKCKACLYINDQPPLKLNKLHLETLKALLADDVKHYDDMSEYRLSDQRHKQILIFY